MEEKYTKESNRHIEAVLKALDILDCFVDEDSLTLKQITERTGLVRSRTMRITGTLISRGYLNFDTELGLYALGSRLMALGDSFKKNNNLIDIVRPVLKHLVKRTEESATFAIKEAGKRVVLAREEGTHAIRYTIEEGQRMPLHAGAGGKVLLAFGPKDELDEFLAERKLKQVTSDTITDPKLLKEDLSKIRKKGFSISRNEGTPGAQAVAAPVFNFSNQLVGVLSVSGPIDRFKGKNIENILKCVLEASNLLSKTFGKEDKSEG